MSPGWLLAGLREVAEFARRNPDIAERVRSNPSGFLDQERDPSPGAHDDGEGNKHPGRRGDCQRCQ